MEPLIKQIIMAQEGYRPQFYKDTKGNWTVFYGHKYTGNEPEAEELSRMLEVQNMREREGNELSEEEIRRRRDLAEKILERDLAVAEQDAKTVIPNYNKLDAVRRAALISMSYSMGRGGLSKFEKMAAALAKGDTKTAAEEVLTGREPGTKSKFLRDTGLRALDVSHMIKSGTLSPRLRSLLNERDRSNIERSIP